MRNQCRFTRNFSRKSLRRKSRYCGRLNTSCQIDCSTKLPFASTSTVASKMSLEKRYGLSQSVLSFPLWLTTVCCSWPAHESSSSHCKCQKITIMIFLSLLFLLDDLFNIFSRHRRKLNTILDSTRFGLFLMCFNTAYKLVLCLMRRMGSLNDAVNAPVAGFVSGLTLAMDSTNRR